MLTASILLLLADALPADRPKESKLEQSAPGGVVRFEGVISEGTERTLIERLERPMVRRLLITSSGGDEASALRIAEIVRRRGLSVVARGMCMSACAQIVLLSSSDATVEPGTLVGMHQSAWAIHERSRLSSARDRLTVSTIEGSRRLHDRTEAVLGARTRLDLLRIAFARVEPSCMAEPDAGSSGQPRVRMRHRFWIPGRRLLERAGVRTLGGAIGTDRPDVDPAVARFARSMDMSIDQSELVDSSDLERC